MPLQDLTPELRTRLNRVERWAGWFVLLALCLLLVGLAYYIHHTAQRRGWFVVKARYFTLLDRATGLQVGDPVKLMGFEVGRITRVEAQPPEDFYYNVYVEFEIRAPYYGYLWTTGSRVRVTPADLWGKRELEVTKGTGGTPTYIFHPLRELSLSEAEQLTDPNHWQLAEDIYDAEAPHILIPALTRLQPEVLQQLRKLGRTRIRLLNTRETRRWMTGIWNDREARYDPYTPRTAPYWLRAEETPALTERLDHLVRQVEEALPGLLALTNEARAMLGEFTALTRELRNRAEALRPTVEHLNALAAQLRGEGALGAWLLEPALRAHLQEVLAMAPQTLTQTTQLLGHADQSLLRLTDELAQSLEHLAAITGGLRQQVESNPDMLETISRTLRHVDELVQGLKRHWLLRSAFRPRAPQAPESSKPGPDRPVLQAPNDPGH
ncbi:MAG: MlaD family protein [Verrucomicrobiota bacterium]|nr:MlaD family protein [Limisphaera sp.]MDW8381233.1 MlaD family protein [Verrucomicrobiota bacterium]